MKAKLVSGWIILNSLLLFLYSFTQVDLGLTLSRVSIWQGIQKSFQYLGYFQRTNSVVIFIGLLFSYFISYILYLHLSSKNLLAKKTVWVTILVSTLILLFSYNAFSYDLFNYIFDGKIITHYHLNPYTHKALDFAGDPMLGFMHWTQRTYPYGPLWLALTVPVSFLGFNIFLLTFFLFKALIVASYLGCIWVIQKITKTLNGKEDIFAVILFAFNPLVIIESVVSAHNDIVMMFFALLGLYFIMDNKNIRGIFMVIISICIKFATIFMSLSLLFAFISRFLKKKLNWHKIILSIAVLQIIPVILASVRTNFQPWYILYIMPFGAILGKKYYSVIPFITFSFFCLLEYAPFLYLGNWNPPVPTILSFITGLGIALSVLMIILWYIKLQRE